VERFERIRYGVEEGIATLTLNRPEKRNALDDQTVAELRRAIAIAEGDDEVRVLLLRGAGPAFCAGADLAQLERIAAGAGPLENLADAEALGRLLVEMRRLGKPVIAAVHGQAFAGGAGLATACDLVVASDDAHFGYPEVHLGFVPAMVMALLRRVCGEKAAFEIVSRGDRIGAEEARRLGLVNRIYPAPTFEQDALEYARELASRSPAALRLIKRLFYGIDGAPVEEAIARGAEVNVLARTTEDTRAGVRRFLESRRER
jgi:methylglutaconyl-CoA hydratase